MPAHPTAKAGSVQFSVKNNDGIDHTFTVTGTSVDIAVPGGGTGSATATLKAGDYEFHCKIHSSMTGTLTISPS
jgi:plastocyanin